MKIKLNTLLSITDQLRVSYKNMVNDYSKFFSKSQGAFKGEKRTYVAREGTIDDPSKRGITLVTTTVREKLDYFIENTSEFINSLFSQERTNATGVAHAKLVVGGKEWGDFTSLELLRMKSLLESSDLGNLEAMLSNIPVRSDAEVWVRSEDAEYSSRDVFETEMFKGVNKTTIKIPFVPLDPNLQGKDLPVNYQAQVIQRDEVLELGDYTRQSFSGEWSHKDRAATLKRREVLLIAITKALKDANNVEAVESEITAKRIFEYLFFDK